MEPMVSSRRRAHLRLVFSGKDEYRNPLFKPEPGPNLDQVKLMYEESGAFIFGRRTFDMTNGWNGAHP